MAQRRMNKNVVASLTVGGMALVITVVAVGAISKSQRDPAVLAEKAAAAERAGDFVRAMNLFNRAFEVHKDAKYKLDTSRTAFAAGDVGRGVGELDLAFKQAPDDPKIVAAVIEKAWELFRVGWPQPDQFLTYADAMLKLEPENVSALTARSVAAEQLRAKDPSKGRIADEALAKAMSINEHQPELALLRAERELSAVQQQYAGKTLDPRERAAATAKFKEAQGRAADILRASLAKYPKHERLILGAVGIIRAAGDLTLARSILEAGVEAVPESSDLHYAVGELLYNGVLQSADAPKGEERVALAEKALAHIKRSIDLDPSWYPSYTLRASLATLIAEANGRLASEQAAVAKEVLDALTKARIDTAGLRSARATINYPLREQMFVDCFKTASDFWQSAADADKPALLAQAQRVVDDLRTQYKESAWVPLLSAQIAVTNSDTKLAVALLEKAEQDAGKQNRPLVSLMAKEQLVRVHAAEGRAKPALDRAVEAVKMYDSAGREPPMWLLMQTANMLNALDRSEEAMTMVDELLRREPENKDLKALRARALAKLGRSSEAQEAIASLEDPKFQLERARIQAHGGDLGAAEATARAVLDADPDSTDAMRLFVQIAMKAERGEAAAAHLESLIPRMKQDVGKTAARTYIILSRVTDPAERDAALLKLIDEVTDPCDRAAEYFNFYLIRRDYEKASPYLEEVAKCRKPDDVEILRLRFAVAVSLKKADDAEQWAAKLTQANADRAGGATFRGQLKLARDDAEGAVSEFRAAERELPSDLELKTRLADALLRCKPPRLDEAITTLKQAVEFDPRNFNINRLLFLCLEQNGQREAGIPYLEAAARVNPEDPLIKQNQLLLEESKDPQKGIAWREKRAQEQPDDVDNQLRLVELYARVNDHEKAQARIEQAFKAAPADQPAVAARVALAGSKYFADAKNREAGEKFLRNFIDTTGSGASKIDGHIMLSRFYEAIGDPTQANAVLLDAERSVAQFAGNDPLVRDRGKIAVGLAMADFCGRTRRWDEQVDALRSVLAVMKPDHERAAETRLQLIQALTIREDVTGESSGESEKELNAYLRDYPKDVRGLVAKADLLVRRSSSTESLNEVRDLVSRVLAEKPDHVWSLYTRGRISTLQGRYAEARDDLVRAKRANPSALDYAHRFELARLYEKIGQPGLAEAEWRDLLRDVPERRSVPAELIAMLERTGQSDKAVAFVGEMIARQPREWFWHYQRARLFERRREYAVALDSIRTAVQLQGGGAGAELLGAYFDVLNKAGRSAEVISAANTLRPDQIQPRLRAAIADAYVRTSDRASATREYETGMNEAAARDIDELNFLIAMCNSVLGRETATEIINRVRTKPNADLPFELRSGICLAQLKVNARQGDEVRDGVKVAEEVIAKAPPGSKLQLAAMVVRAIGLQHMEDFKGAAEAYEQILKLSPNDIQSLNNLAYLLADRLEQPELAMKYAEQAERTLPGNANILDTLGYVHFKRRNFTQAESTYLESLRIDPESMPVHLHLGQLYETMGRKTDAKRTYEKLAELAKQSQDDEFIKRAEEALKRVE